jgi:hypothetical protein
LVATLENLIRGQFLVLIRAISLGHRQNPQETQNSIQGSAQLMAHGRKEIGFASVCLICFGWSHGDAQRSDHLDEWIYRRYVPVHWFYEESARCSGMRIAREISIHAPLTPNGRGRRPRRVFRDRRGVETVR